MVLYQQKRTKDRKMNIKTLINNHVVFVDTSSFMHPDAALIFLKNKEGFVGENRILVPIEVSEEIDKMRQSKNAVKARKAKTARIIFDKMRQSKQIEVGTFYGKTFVDNIFNTLFTEKSIKHQLCLITQDNALAADIMQLSKSKSVKNRKSIIVLQIKQGGILVDFNTKRNTKNNLASQIPLPSTKQTSPFEIVKRIKKNKKTQKLIVKEIPKEGSLVYTENRKRGPIFLTRQIGSGAEGIIYETNFDKYICKIFNEKSLSNFKKEKLRLMTSRKLGNLGICWPNYLVYNSHAEFVGFTMKRALGVEIGKSIFNKLVFLRIFPGWKKIDLVNICEKILKQIEILHRKNVLIGDINERNILVTEDRKVFLVDTDSYQVEDYPCTVGRMNFTAPEIQNKDFKTFLRTKAHENFAVATLIFMILIPGKTPYSHQGGESPAENIKVGLFPYPLGKIRGKKTPLGPWRYIWSHLPYYMKEAFFEVFQNGNRLNVNEWLDRLKRYKNDLNKGFVSNEIYQNTYKEYKEV